MLFKDALEKAEKDPNVEKLMREGYFLGSVFATAQESIGEWILHFYSSKKNKVVDCYIRDGVELSEEMDAIKKMEKLAVDDVKITAQNALDKAKEQFKGNTVNILMVLHEKDGKAVWTINMIDLGMTATSYDIDASNGNIIGKSVTSLVTRYTKSS